METVLDSSAVLALILNEDGRQVVAAAIAAGAGLCRVNLAEVATRCVLVGMPQSAVRNLVARLPVELVDGDADLALRAADMAPLTKPFGLSLGDRYCLALAARAGVPALTADRARQQGAAKLGVAVKLIR